MSTKKAQAPIDPAAAREAILEAIAAATEPVPITTLGSLPALGRKLAGTKILDLLTTDLDSTVFRWRSAVKEALWSRDAKAFARQQLLETAAVEVLSRTDLVKKAAASTPPLSPAAVKAVAAELIDIAVTDPKALKNIDKLVTKIQTDFANTRRFVPQDPKLVRAKIRRFLKNVR